MVSSRSFAILRFLLAFHTVLVFSQSSRDPFLWPFATDSIWNMPIGSKAVYAAAGFNYTKQLQGDTDYIYRVQASDPLVEWYPVANWAGPRCEITSHKPYDQIHIPTSLIIPDVHVPGFTWNNAAAFLQPDNRTLIQMNPIARCVAGGPIFGYTTPHEIRQFEDIYGAGISGGHGGSGMSSIGGTIRVDELLPSSGPIRHALKIEVYAHAFLYKYPPGYRWPALNADGYAFNHTEKHFYDGDNPNVVMGALLAIPPSYTISSLQIQTEPAQKIFHALQDYGSYMVSDTAYTFYAICVEQGAMEQFESTYGYPFTSSSGAWFDDIVKIFSVLHAVTNNAPNSIGGGGVPRQPLAPPITPPSES